MKATSLFEIIGPEMIGPSSSHTAGMVRIGMMARRIAGPPLHIALYLHQMFQYLYQGHKTDAAMIGGAIGMDQKDPRLRHAVELAQAQHITLEPVQFYPDATLHPNTVGLVIENARRCHVRGISIGGGSIVIDQIDGAAVHLLPDRYYAVVWTRCEILSKLTRQFSGEITGGMGENGYVYALSSSQPFPADTEKMLRADPSVTHVQLTEPLLEFGCAPTQPELPASCAALIQTAQTTDTPLWQLALEYEQRRSGQNAADILQLMTHNWQQMKRSVALASREPQKPLYGLVDGKDAQRLRSYLQNEKTLSGTPMLETVARALAVMEYNASMGCIIAAPTAGSSGIVPACLVTTQQRYNRSDDEMVHGLLVAALFGVVMAHRGISFSGAVGGCQGEVGVSSAIAAAAMASILSSDPAVPAQAMAISLKNILGLVCDPVAGPVEVPCVKRNAIGVANATVAADLALAGICSYVPPDDVIDALLDVEQRMPREVKAGGGGGLAGCRAAQALRASLEDGSFFQNK